MAQQQNALRFLLEPTPANTRGALSNFDFERRAYHTCMFYAHTQANIYGAVSFCWLFTFILGG